MDCQICTEKFNKTTRKQLSCPKCNEIFCLQCVQTYVAKDNFICFSCKANWDYEFLISQFSKKFLNKEFKQLQQTKLFDIEKSLLPETVYFVDLIQKKDKLLQEKVKLCHEIEELHYKIAKIDEEVAFCTEEVYGKAVSKYIPKIIGGCPNQNCRGFIDRENFTCGICQTTVCKKCREILKDTREHGAAEVVETSDHVCLEENIESMKMLMKECKPCPKCSAFIYKTEGCDQMFCIQCNTAFSWNTGIVETGRIHNPHYYDWVRQNNNGEVPREPENVCPTELISYYSLKTRYHEIVHMTDYIRQKTDGIKKVFNLHGNLVHLADVTLRELRFDRNDNKHLRIRYLLGTVTEEDFKKTLESRFRIQKKNIAIADCLQLFYDIMKDNFSNLYQASFTNLKEFKENYKQVALFTNENILKVEKMYNCSLSRYKYESNFFTDP
jgi:hypothetical protein